MMCLGECVSYLCVCASVFASCWMFGMWKSGESLLVDIEVISCVGCGKSERRQGIEEGKVGKKSRKRGYKEIEKM